MVPLEAAKENVNRSRIVFFEEVRREDYGRGGTRWLGKRFYFFLNFAIIVVNKNYAYFEEIFLFSYHGRIR